MPGVTFQWGHISLHLGVFQICPQVNSTSLHLTLYLCTHSCTTDMIKGHTRSDPASEVGCSSLHKFLFEWGSTGDLLLEKSLLRVYLKSVDSRINGHGVYVNVTAGVKLVWKKLYDLDLSYPYAEDEMVWRFVEVLKVKRGFQQYLEVGVGEQLALKWEQCKSGESLIEVQLRYDDIACESGENRPVPLELSNPVTLDLDDPRREQEQAFLVVFANDMAVRRRIHTESEPVDNSTLPKINIEKRAVRSSHNSLGCGLVNYTINFTELGLHYVIAPPSVNIMRCQGSCSVAHIGLVPSTHSAQLLASARTYYTYIGPAARAPVGPCCNPTEYESMYLLVVGSTMLLQLEAELKVKNCICG